MPSIVCTRFGWMASRSSAAIAPVTFELVGERRRRRRGSSATTMRPRRVSQVAQVLGQAQRGHDLGGGGDEEAGLARHAVHAARRARPPTLRSARSLTSRTRFHSTWRTSMPSALPWWRWLSSAAASRLWAEVIAWKSPVKWRLMSSIGTTCERPPPVPPPFMPSVGPIDGSRSAMTGRAPIRQSACPSPMVMVVLPSPAGVGVMDDTTTSLPSGWSRRAASARSSTLALSRP